MLGMDCIGIMKSRLCSKYVPVKRGDTLKGHTHYALFVGLALELALELVIGGQF